MTCFIVTFETANKESNQSILNTIQSYPTHAQICKNTWVIVTDDEATNVRNKLKQIIGPDDRIFIIKSGEEAGWVNVICEKSWLHKYLMNEY